MDTQTKNREAWLTEVARSAEPLFNGYRIAPYRVTCGWPCKGAAAGKVLGECHGAQSSTGGVFELFITPYIDKPLQVAGVLCHEMAHVIAGTDARHGSGFVRVCNHAGLTKGKPKHRMPGQLLDDRLAKIIEALGPYPHQALKPAVKVVVKGKSVVRLVCACGCSCVMPVKWLAEAGYPICGCGGEMTDTEE